MILSREIIPIVETRIKSSPSLIAKYISAEKAITHVTQGNNVVC